jgi:hypothetical protein
MQVPVCTIVLTCATPVSTITWRLAGNDPSFTSKKAKETFPCSLLVFTRPPAHRCRLAGRPFQLRYLDDTWLIGPGPSRRMGVFLIKPYFYWRVVNEGEDWVAARIVVISFFSFLWPLTLVNEVHVSNNALSVKIFFLLVSDWFVTLQILRVLKEIFT